MGRMPSLTVGEAEAKRLLDLPNAFPERRPRLPTDNYNLPPGTGTTRFKPSLWSRFKAWLGGE